MFRRSVLHFSMFSSLNTLIWRIYTCIYNIKLINIYKDLQKYVQILLCRLEEFFLTCSTILIIIKSRAVFTCVFSELYSDATWVAWHLKWQEAQLFLHQLVQTNIKETSKICIIGPLWGGIHQWLVYSSDKGSVKRDVINSVMHAVPLKNIDTVCPLLCFVVVRYSLILSMSFRVTLLVIGQSHGNPEAMGKCLTWKQRNNDTISTKHNKTLCRPWRQRWNKCFSQVDAFQNIFITFCKYNFFYVTHEGILPLFSLGTASLMKITGNFDSLVTKKHHYSQWTICHSIYLFDGNPYTQKMLFTLKEGSECYKQYINSKAVMLAIPWCLFPISCAVDTSRCQYVQQRTDWMRHGM